MLSFLKIKVAIFTKPYRSLLVKLSPDDKNSQREARLCLSLNHPNVIHTIKSTIINDERFLIMEYTGKFLSDAFEDLAGGPGKVFTENLALQITRQLGLAISFLHEHQLLHRYNCTTLILFLHFLDKYASRIYACTIPMYD